MIGNCNSAVMRLLVSSASIRVTCSQQPFSCSLNFVRPFHFGQGWARTVGGQGRFHPTSATVGPGIYINSKSFGVREVDNAWGGCVESPADSTTHLCYLINVQWLENVFDSCRWLLGARLPLRSAGERSPQTLCAHPTSKLWLRCCLTHLIHVCLLLSKFSPLIKHNHKQ